MSGSEPAGIRDVLGPGLTILLVGFNPGLRSGATGHHYAGPGNQFWRLLAEAGLTPPLLRPVEGRLLPEFGLGLTNLVARPTASAADLAPGELRAGVPRLRELVGRYRGLYGEGGVPGGGRAGAGTLGAANGPAVRECGRRRAAVAERAGAAVV